MKEWKKCNIGEICDTISDTYKGNASDVVLINTSDVLEGKCLNHTFVTNKDLRGQFKKQFKKNDILYSEIRPANKRYAFIDFEPTDYIASTKLMVIRSNDKVLPKFLYYILQSKEMIETLQFLAESRSGTFPQITFSELAIQTILLPEVKEQNKIVNFLEALDSKIELNRRINDNLEQQAQALFKAWFVDFEPFKGGKLVDSELGRIPEGWSVGYLSDIANITMGQSPDGKSYNDVGTGMIFYQGRAEFGHRFPSIRLYTTRPNKIAAPFSILLSVRAPVGDINVANCKCCIGRGLAAIQSINNCQSFLLYLLQSLKPLFNQYNGEGTVFGSINKESLSNIKIIIPKIEVIRKFESIIENMDNMILKHFLQSRNVIKLRDTLLPRLMSGELKINDLNR